MPGGTTIDYGKIASDTLNKDAPTALGNEYARIQVSCDAPTLFAIKPTDERAGSAITGTGVPTDAFFGLGKTGSTNIGAYKLTLVNSNTDGKPLYGMRKAIGDTSYKLLTELQPGAITAFSDRNVVVPAAFKNVTSTILLNTYIQKASALPLDKEIKFDGLATLEVTYL